MSPDFEIEEEPDVHLRVSFRTDRTGLVVSYSLVLIALRDGGWQTVRVWDNAHGVNEMHRYTRTGGKQRGEIFYRGDFGAAMRVAHAEALAAYRAMIESWDR
ncbi:MAG: hypothetical protein QOJ38_1244 [Solirubrobacterales bacterium]|nr:hypothetical protein [Solirubrobacterales bacterium]